MVTTDVTRKIINGICQHWPSDVTLDTLFDVKMVLVEIFRIDLKGTCRTWGARSIIDGVSVSGSKAASAACKQAKVE